MSGRRTAGIALALVLGASAVVGLGVDARGQRRAVRGQDVSPVVFPPRATRMRAAHGHPAHRRLRCQRCHRGTTGSHDSGDVLLPEESSCLPCHAEEITRDDPAPERCGVCHVGYDDGVVPASELPESRVRFSHRTHAREGIRCLRCHEGVNDPDGERFRHLPGMRSCFECHGGTAPTASGECSTCHVTRPDGRLRTRWPEGWMNPPRWLRGMHHDADFLVRHRWVGADAVTRNGTAPTATTVGSVPRVSTPTTGSRSTRRWRAGTSPGARPATRRAPSAGSATPGSASPRSRPRTCAPVPGSTRRRRSGRAARCCTVARRGGA